MFEQTATHAAHRQMKLGVQTDRTAVHRLGDQTRDFLARRKKAHAAPGAKWFFSRHRRRRMRAR